MRYNNISDSGMVPLSDALKVSSALSREISSFALLPLAVPGNTAILACLFVQENSAITELNLAGNRIGDKGIIPLSDAIKVSFVLFREISSFAVLLLR